VSEILLKAEDARGASNDMKTNAAMAQDQFTATRTRLTELASSFKGQTATNFDLKFEEWRKGATTMIDALNGLADFLKQAADTIEQTDADIAAKLNG
jgi:WXG100 family type VII secretion target